MMEALLAIYIVGVLVVALAVSFHNDPPPKKHYWITVPLAWPIITLAVCVLEINSALKKRRYLAKGKN